MSNYSVLTVEVRMRPLWKRILRFPFVWRAHYRTFYRHGYRWNVEGIHRRILALYAAWILAGVTLSTKRRGARTP